MLLPQSGQLAAVAQALRDGFLAGYYQAQQENQTTPEVVIYDSSQVSSMSQFYSQAQQDGIQLVVGPLEKQLVTQLNEQPQLPITTLALNYSDVAQAGPAQLFQFGLSAEDEAREVARRAWDDGMRRAVAGPSGEWGDRVLAAFQQSWLAAGGSLIAAEHVNQPVELAQQIASPVSATRKRGPHQAVAACSGSKLPRNPRADKMSTLSFLPQLHSKRSKSNRRWPSSTQATCRFTPPHTYSMASLSKPSLLT